VSAEVGRDGPPGATGFIITIGQIPEYGTYYFGECDQSTTVIINYIVMHTIDVYIRTRIIIADGWSRGRDGTSWTHRKRTIEARLTVLLLHNLILYYSLGWRRSVLMMFDDL